MTLDYNSSFYMFTLHMFFVICLLYVPFILNCIETV